MGSGSGWVRAWVQGTLIKCSPNCGPSGSLVFVGAVLAMMWLLVAVAVAATVASIIAAVRKVGQVNNKNAPKRSRQAREKKKHFIVK